AREKASSESRVKSQNARVELKHGTQVLRTPISAPFVRTNGVTRATTVVGSFGSTVIVVPRASLLWNPKPPLRYTSVRAQGPKIRLSLGLKIASVLLPELTARSLSTLKTNTSSRSPSTVRTLGSHCVWFW